MSLPDWLTKLLFCEKCGIFTRFFQPAFDGADGSLVCTQCHTKYVQEETK